MQGKQNCLRLVDWGLGQPIESFVFTDEMIIEIGAPRGSQKITQLKGKDPYAFVIHDKCPNGFSVMVSGSIALGFKGPLLVWMKETPEERKENEQALAKENEQKRQWVQQRHINATIPGTAEWSYFQAVN